MIILLLSLALWFLCGAEAFAMLVREKAKTDLIRCMGGEWDVYWGDSWAPFAGALLLCMVMGLGVLVYQLAGINPKRLYNFGFSIVAKTVVPWDIARKLEGEEKKQPAQAAQAATKAPASLAAQQQAFSQLLSGSALQTGLAQPQSQQLGLQGFGQPPSKP